MGELISSYGLLLQLPVSFLVAHSSSLSPSWARLTRCFCTSRSSQRSSSQTLINYAVNRPTRNPSRYPSLANSLRLTGARENALHQRNKWHHALPGSQELNFQVLNTKLQLHMHLPHTCLLGLLGPMDGTRSIQNTNPGAIPPFNLCSLSYHFSSVFIIHSLAESHITFG